MSKGEYNPQEEPFLEHLRAGYQNAQDTIRFIDSKVPLLVSLATFVLGGLFAFAKWAIESEGSSGHSPVALALDGHVFWERFFLLTTFISLVGFLFCLFGCLWTILARPPSAPQLAHTILFPYYTANTRDEVNAYMLDCGMSTQLSARMVQEYQDQTFQVGCILSRKLSALRRGAWGFVFELSSVAITIAFFLVRYYWVLRSD